MTHTQSTSEASSTNPAPGSPAAAGGNQSNQQDFSLHTPRTQARLDDARDAELLRVDADRQYNECLLDAPVVVYGSGKGCVAVVPAIRNVNPDASGEWVLQPAKTGKTLQRWRGSIVGVYRRGFCPDTAMWKLSAEQAAALTRGGRAVTQVQVAGPGTPWFASNEQFIAATTHTPSPTPHTPHPHPTPTPHTHTPHPHPTPPL
eukprot:COSAG03_NODE_1065_length_4923_cov_17.103648_8_plen_203_part_00